MFSAFKSRQPDYDDPITGHPYWNKANERAGKLSMGQLDAWFLAVSAGLIRQREQYVHSVDPMDDLEEMLLAIVSLTAVTRETQRRVKYNQGH